MKKYLFGLIAVFFAVATVAFTTSNKKDVQFRYFEFVGTDEQTATIQNSANWNDVGTSNPGECLGTLGICIVKYDVDLGSFSSFISSQSATSLQSGGYVDSRKE